MAKEQLEKLSKEELIEIITEIEENNTFYKKTEEKLEEIKIKIQEDGNDLNNHLIDSQREMIDALNKKLFKVIEEKRNLSKELYEIKKLLK